MCLFIAFPSFGGRRRTLNQIASPYKPHCAAGLAVVVRANDLKRCVLYRDSRSNPIATVLPRRCQPLVMRIVLGFEK